VRPAPGRARHLERAFERADPVDQGEHLDVGALEALLGTSCHTPAPAAQAAIPIAAMPQVVGPGRPIRLAAADIRQS
jgi:hypothetical protein